MFPNPTKNNPHVEVLTPIPQNMTIFGDRPLIEIIK
jgi:hypothetical protein